MPHISFLVEWRLTVAGWGSSHVAQCAAGGMRQAGTIAGTVQVGERRLCIFLFTLQASLTDGGWSTRAGLYLVRRMSYSSSTACTLAPIH
jgi:hypothetical protein